MKTTETFEFLEKQKKQTTTQQNQNHRNLGMYLASGTLRGPLRDPSGNLRGPFGDPSGTLLRFPRWKRFPSDSKDGSGSEAIPKMDNDSEAIYQDTASDSGLRTSHNPQTTNKQAKSHHAVSATREQPRNAKRFRRRTTPKMEGSCRAAARAPGFDSFSRFSPLRSTCSNDFHQLFAARTATTSDGGAAGEAGGDPGSMAQPPAAGPCSGSS